VIKQWEKAGAAHRGNDKTARIEPFTINEIAASHR
jgi:hypothetical protein